MQSQKISISIYICKFAEKRKVIFFLLKEDYFSCLIRQDKFYFSKKLLQNNYIQGSYKDLFSVVLKYLRQLKSYLLYWHFHKTLRITITYKIKI